MHAPALALDTIEVEVFFYDGAEKAKLLAYASLDLPPSIANSATQTGGYVHFPMSG